MAKNKSGKVEILAEYPHPVTCYLRWLKFNSSGKPGSSIAELDLPVAESEKAGLLTLKVDIWYKLSETALRRWKHARNVKMLLKAFLKLCNLHAYTNGFTPEFAITRTN